MTETMRGHMPKPTTKDLARAAGVSLATVDRVLNGRDGVRRATIDKVNDAISRIGFVRDLTAANLARKREYSFAFVLPDRTNEFLSQITSSIKRAANGLAQERARVRLERIPTHDPTAVVRTLEALAEDGVDGIALMAPETPQTRDAIQRIKDQDIAIVSFVADQPNAPLDRYVGINDTNAGQTAATLVGRFSGPAPGTVLVVAETIQSRESLDRRHGFDKVLQLDFPLLKALPTIETYGDSTRTDQVLGNALGTAEGLRAIYFMGSASAEATRALGSRNLPENCVIVAHELTETTRKGLQTDFLSAVITQDVEHLVRSALRVLRAKADNLPMIESQERIRIEIILRTNLPVS